jgi:hypothetical protein
MTFIERAAMLKAVAKHLLSQKERSMPCPPRPGRQSRQLGRYRRRYRHLLHLRQPRQPRTAGRHAVAGR